MISLQWRLSSPLARGRTLRWAAALHAALLLFSICASAVTGSTLDGSRAGVLSAGSAFVFNTSNDAPLFEGR